MSTSVRTATRDERLYARVVWRMPLTYPSGADPSEDRPAHVRAASGIAVLAGRIAIVQDDTNFVAIVDPMQPAAVRAVPLPPGADGRRQFGLAGGNKHLKLDLEACFAIASPEPVLIAFGSGSAEARESVVWISGWPDALAVRHFHARELYAALREATLFAGSELNIEGAIVRGDALWLFNRGNGMRGGAREPVNSTCQLSWPALLAYLEDGRKASVPVPQRIQQFVLGELGGIPLSFTDAATWRDAILYSAAAEDSPDAVRDGPVLGSVIGMIDEKGEPRWTPITDASGEILREKAEGLVVFDHGGGEVWMVADSDDEASPSELWKVRLTGPWQSI